MKMECSFTALLCSLRKQPSFAAGATLLLVSSAVSAQLPVYGDEPPEINIHESGNQMTVSQEANRAVMDWQEFSIGAGYRVHCEQEAHQAILNRVVSNIPSEILGELTAGGAVWLITPNGVLIGQGAVINTRSFLATTLHINDNDFLNPGSSSLD